MDQRCDVRVGRLHEEGNVYVLDEPTTGELLTRYGEQANAGGALDSTPQPRPLRDPARPDAPGLS